jgi:predicted solute-binding protein
MESVIKELLQFGTSGLVSALFIYAISEFKKMFSMNLELTKTAQIAIDKNTESTNKLTSMIEKQSGMLDQIDNTNKMVFQQFLESVKNKQ